jgi:DtxR family Mn-dependent transcriptional regulator
MPEDSVPVFEGYPDLLVTTESEQMYLITIARAVEDGASGPVPVARLASALEVSAASANEMIRKLVVKGLVDYQPYKGAELTDTGRSIAVRVLRTRRLWATFLAGQLDFTPGEADALACHLEHVTPPEAAERLAHYLGNPTTGPLGMPIPDERGLPAAPRTRPLSAVAVGSTVEIVSIGASTQVQRFLIAEALEPGSIVTVRAAGASGLLLESQGRTTALAPEIADAVNVIEQEAP